MNEQLIDDLFAEATRRMTGSSSREFSQKLAELIVNECAKQLDVYKMMKLDPSFYSSMLRKHFGVGQ